MPGKYALVVCGPTASGKSEVSDTLADSLTEVVGHHVSTLVVDSMQVYREVPVITNQARRRQAELVGIVSVTGEWSVADHRARAEEITSPAETTHFVLDAGTGMYLNALLLDFPLAPRVPQELRARAQAEAADEKNPRRAARARELILSGARERGSVWDGGVRHDTTIVYLRPDRPRIDAAIAERSRKIARDGQREAGLLRGMIAEGAEISPQVMDSVGVRELLQYLSGTLTLGQAEERIATRTRRFARRQMRWFDKLTRTLEDRTRIIVLEDRHQAPELHNMHDIIGV
jgi:tRNA dimethylallyltransferase